MRPAVVLAVVLSSIAWAWPTTGRAAAPMSGAGLTGALAWAPAARPAVAAPADPAAADTPPPVVPQASAAPEPPPDAAGVAPVDAAPVDAAPPPPPVFFPRPSLRELAPPPLRRAGLLHKGVNIDVLALGSVQAIGAGTTSVGVMLGHGAEIDLGPRLALRLTLQLALAPGSLTVGGDSDAASFVAAYLAPSLVYRFRDSERQHWIPFVNAGVNLGTHSFGRKLLGLDAAPANHEQTFALSGPGPALGAGLLFSPFRLIALRVAVDYAYYYVAHTSLHVLSETLALRISI